MPLQLDPSYPLVWRSPHSLQLGVDAPPVVLDDLSEVEERMLAALVKGISRSGLTVVATTSGGDDADAARLLRAVRPALLRSGRDAEASGGPVVVLGRGHVVDHLHEALAASGFPVAGTASTAPALAVLVAHFVIEPESHGYWLRRDVPHLPIVFGDTSVRVGPIVEPGHGPCLYCLELARTDADPAWPAIASQLWGRRSRLDRGILAWEVAAIATRLVADRLQRARPAVATSLRIAAATGVRRTERWQRHPRCACSALPGTSTAAEQPAASVPSATTTAAVAIAPA